MYGSIMVPHNETTFRVVERHTQCQGPFVSICLRSRRSLRCLGVSLDARSNEIGFRRMEEPQNLRWLQERSPAQGDRVRDSPPQQRLGYLLASVNAQSPATIDRASKTMSALLGIPARSVLASG